jgi:phosphoribosylformylglycinamidine synthase PurS subunit
MMFSVRIDVTHLPGVLDPQGATVERALPALGYTNVTAVSIAKTIRLLVDAASEDAARTQVDEMLTPDSSRYWSGDEYRVGTSPPSFDKQYVRDYYRSIGWNLEPPIPRLPAEVIDGTRARYVEAYEHITGLSFDSWYGTEG